MKKKWKVVGEELETEEGLKEKYSSLILKILASRGLRKEKEIEAFFASDYEKNLHSPFLFSDMEKAVERIRQAKEKKERIAIFGDYDADGVTATALVHEALTKIGFQDIIYYIPDRQSEGYGLNEKAIQYLAEQGVALVLTVDCGITSISEVEMAKKMGMDVIITDHHHAPLVLPEAWAIINPQVNNCGYPEKILAGVGVAFKLIQALYLRECPEKIEQLKWFLDLVAIGTVADCVPLLGENRVLVRYGLIVLSKTKRIGLVEMFKVGRIVIDENNIPDTQKISFQIAPRINAAGRMDHASSSLKLMIESDVVKARDLALEVESRNQSRQKMTAEITREVKALAENSFKDKNLIFASSEHWPVGILGLIAGKVADEFNKPTAIFQKQKEGYVGSFRSTPHFNIVEALEKCSDLLIKFGGHAQAAGASLKEEHMQNFYQKLLKISEEEIVEKNVLPSLEIDGEISSKDMDWSFLESILRLQPFGEGNREPVFLMRGLEVEDIRFVGNGNKHLKLNLRAQDSPKIFDAIGFGLGENELGLKKDDSIEAVFHLRQDEWNGNKKMQLFLIDMKKQAYE